MSFFHNLKKSVSEHQKGNEVADLDPQYESVLLKNFTLQFESSNKLKTSINSFIAHVQGILQSSSDASLCMHNIYSGNDNTPPPVDNNANGVSASVKAGMQSASSAASSLLSSINGAVEKLQIKASGAPPGGDPDVSAIIPLSARAHNELLQSHCQRVSGILIRECITPIDDILNELLSIQQLMKERNKDMKEVIYYMSKLDELKKDREERAAKGKADKPEHLDKFERNQQKLNEVRAVYDRSHEKLCTAMRAAWETRQQKIAPVFLSYTKHEKEFIAAYAQAMQSL